MTVTGPDPAYLVDEGQLDEAVSCPVSVSQARETVLLIHGTGVTWVYQMMLLISVVTLTNPYL